MSYGEKESLELPSELRAELERRVAMLAVSCEVCDLICFFEPKVTKD